MGNICKIISKTERISDLECRYVFCLQMCPHFLFWKVKVVLIFDDFTFFQNIAVDVVAPVCEPLNVSNRQSVQTNTVYPRVHVEPCHTFVTL